MAELPAGRWSRSGRAVALLGILSGFALGGCAHTIGPAVPFERGPRYDFAHPPCEPAGPPKETTPDDRVVIRYLGAGGLFVGWRGHALLTGPFFSNPGALRVGFGHVRPDEEAIEEGLKGMPLERVGAILVGHSHYDHLGDLPAVAERIPGATVWVNHSGKRSLAPYGERLAGRLRVIGERAGRWERLADADGEPLPFRVFAVPSDHAPHLGCLGGLLVMDGESPVLERPWEHGGYWRLKTGRTYAFVIDLLEGPEQAAQTRFRIFYQDAASPSAAGSLPGPDRAGETSYDLAVLCMPSAHLVPPYPERILAATEPRHALAIHYEDFFEAWGPGSGFVPNLTKRRADRFLERTTSALDAVPAPAGPVLGICGPTSTRWTMPLVGEWMVFAPREVEP